MSPTTLGISIATRNRWADVEKTLSMVASRPELAGCPVIVIDDGSAQPAPRELQGRFPGVEFLASARSLGASAQRTRIAQMLGTEFILQLDDDSFPIDGSLEDAVAFIRPRPDIVALAFNVVNATDTAVEVDPDLPPYQVKEFIGCGVMFRRRDFVELGGYFHALGFYCEEDHFSSRAASVGKAVYKFPKVVIRHMKTPAARSSSRIAYYQGRNRVLLVLWYYPLRAIPYRLATSLPGTLALVVPRDYPVAVFGFLRGLVDALRMIGQRRPMSYEQYRRRRDLPSCYDRSNAVRAQ